MKYNVGELYEESADLIEAEGWIQDHSYIPGMGYCAVGALEAVTRRHVQGLVDGAPSRESHGLFSELSSRLIEMVNAEFDHPEDQYCGVPDWNDCLSPDKGRQIVLDQLRAAGKKYHDDFLEVPK